MRPFTFSITGPAGSGGGSNGGYGAPASEVYVPAAYGEYHVVVTTNFLDSYSNVGYYAVWQNPSGTTQWVAGYDMWFYPDRGITVKEDRFTFTMVPPPPPPMQDNIKISMVGEKSIWPYLPNQNKNNFSRGADRPGYNPRTNIKVSVTHGNQPVPNKNVIITVKRIEGTGGHDHINPLPLDKCGIIKVGGSIGNPITTRTNQNGEIITDEILASQVSGIYYIETVLASNPIIRDTILVTVSVPKLVLFHNTQENIYVLTGGRCEHHGPRPDNNIPLECMTPNNNHWVNPEMRDSLLKVVKKFYNYTKSKRGHGIVLGLNDMSLPWGGVFDINGKWNLNSDHSFHRVGLSVDIDGSGMSSLDTLKLSDYMRKSRGIRYKEEQIHYGFLGGQ